MHIYGRRLRGGGTSVAALAANYGFVALYNDSTIGHILRVIEYIVATGPAATAIATLSPGAPGSLVGAGIALFAGEQQMAGSIYSGTTVVASPFGVLLNAAATTIMGSRDMPWFYIRPGFSLVIKSDTINTLLVASLWWEDLEMSMLNDCELE